MFRHGFSEMTDTVCTIFPCKPVPICLQNAIKYSYKVAADVSLETSEMPVALAMPEFCLPLYEISDLLVKKWFEW